MSENRNGTKEAGKRLGTFVREDGVELRVNLAEFKGRKFVSLRVWAKEADGKWWPSQMGCSIRLREAGAMAAILSQVASGIGEVMPDAERTEKAPKPEKERKARNGTGPGWGSFEARQAALTAVAGITPPWEGETTFK